MDKQNPPPQHLLSQKYDSYIRGAYSGNTSNKPEKTIYSQKHEQIPPENQTQQIFSNNSALPQKNTSDLPTSIRNTLQLDGSSAYDPLNSFRKPLSPHSQLSTQFKTELNQAIKEFVPQKEDKTSKVVIYQDLRPSSNKKTQSVSGPLKVVEENNSHRIPSNRRKKSAANKAKRYDLGTSDDEIAVEESGSNLMSFVFSRNETSKSTINRSGSNNLKSFQSPNRWSPSSGTKNSKSNISKSSMKLDSNHKENEEAEHIEDKYRRLKCKAKEMRRLLREYAVKCSDMEDLLDERTEQLQHSQNKLNRVQNDYLKHLEGLHNYAEKEEEWAKTEQQLRAVIGELSLSEDQQKKRFEELETIIYLNEQKYFTQVQALESEKQRVYGDMNARDQVMNEQTRVLESLQSELESLRNEKKTRGAQYRELENSNLLRDEEIKRLKDQLAELEVRNKGYVSQIDQLKTTKSHLEEKVSKLKQKFSVEREKFDQENNEALHEKKDKIKALKDEVKRLTEEKKDLELEFERTKDASKALTNSREEIADLQQHNKELKAENENLKVQNDTIFRNQQKEFERAMQLQTDLQKKSKELKKANERADLGEKNLQTVEEIMNQLKTEINLLIDENAKARDYILELEATTAMSNSHYEEVTKELKKLTVENEQHKRDSEQSKRDYEKAKQINRVFENDLNKLEKRVNELQAQQKLQALNDIQDLIQNYRLSHIQHHNQ